jgi:hypothetical protein
MNNIKKDPQVTSFLNKYEIVNLLSRLQEGLKQCQSAVSAYLESKRSSFPRLYFIGDSDLLEILGKFRENPPVVIPNLKNLFQGIESMQFDSNKRLISFSPNLSEIIVFNEPIFTTTPVEHWLLELSTKFFTALEDLLVEYVSGNQFCLQNFPSEIIQVCQAIFFARATEQMIKSFQLQSLK